MTHLAYHDDARTRCGLKIPAPAFAITGGLGNVTCRRCLSCERGSRRRAPNRVRWEDDAMPLWFRRLLRLPWPRRGALFHRLGNGHDLLEFRSGEVVRIVDWMANA